MSTTLLTRRLGPVPCLLAIPDPAPEPLPLVLWFHGLGVDKEVHRTELERLGAEGFLAVGIDAAGHGERRLPDLERKIDAPMEEARRTMLELATATIAEIPTLLDDLGRHAGADLSRVAVAGVSMGGYLVYGAMAAEPRIHTAVSILGSPEWPVGDSPHRDLDAMGRVALLSITAEHDENVPPAAARRLHEALSARAPGSRQRYVELSGAVHLMSAQHWEITMAETLDWLRRFNT